MKIKNLFIPFCIFIISFLYLYLIRAQYLFVSDEGVFSYGAVRILNGEILYKDFYERNSPANYYLLVFLFKIFGINTSVTMLTTFVIFGLIVVLIFLVSKEIKFSPLFSFLLILFFIIDKPSKFMLYSHHWLSTLCALISFLFFLRSSFFISGLFSGLTMTFFYPKGLTLMAGILLGLLILNSKREKRLSNILSCVTGFAVPVISFAIYFISKDAFTEFFYYWLIDPLKGYPKVHVYPTYYYPIKYYLNFTSQQDGLGHGLIISLPILFFGYNLFISAGIFTGIFLLKRKKFFEEYNVYLKIFIITGFLFISCLYRPDDLRLTFISPWTNITFICALKIVIDYFKEGFRQKWRRAILYFFAFSFPIMGATTQLIYNIRYVFYAHSNYEKIETPRGEILVDKRESAVIKEFTRYLEEQEIKELFVYHCLPSIYFIWGLMNPTKYNCLAPYYNSQEELKDAVEQLKKKGTDYVLFLPFYLYQNEQYFPILTDVLFIKALMTDPVWLFLRENFYPILQYKYTRKESKIFKKALEGYKVTLYKRKG